MPRSRNPFDDFFGNGNGNGGDPFDDFFNHGDFDDIFEQMNREIDEIFGGIFSENGHNGPGITIINPNGNDSPFGSRNNNNNNKPDLSSINPNFSSNNNNSAPSNNRKKQNKSSWFKNPFSRNNNNNNWWGGDYNTHGHELNNDDRFRISQAFPWFFSPEKDNNPNINDITSKDDNIHKSPYFPFWNKKEKRLPIENYYNNNNSTNSDYRYNYTSTVITNHGGNIKKVTTIRDNKGERTIEEVYDENNELQSRIEKGDGLNDNLLDNIIKKDSNNNNNNTQIIDHSRPTVFYKPFNIMNTFNRFNKKPGEWFWK